ncbi:acyl-CoA dehydrogenase [Aquabacterium sp.]|uniref:acyl-CoA dehydrogenase n=1 Tax=Aquabacterium sp. TaxID=1872578 RepID=UPI0025C4E17B|nr:acyl-CoA dehydrogenase [Aquabacterium sp.]
MNDYIAPLRDMRFVLRHLAPLAEVMALPGQADLHADVADAILEEANKFASEVLSPLNVVGDREGAHWLDGQVHTATGWRQAYTQFSEGGWNALSCPSAHGGQGLPRLLSALVEEMWNGANLSFALCGMLTRGAIEALELCGSPQQKAIYLPKMISGEWTGTMNLTEPQAGSDLAAVRARALPQPDGSYRVFGQKIFITYGDHDLTDNIVHLVLARMPGAPEGVKGISLFVVPKFLVNADGSLGARNEVRCVSIEHKLGIHGSPTAVLSFGDEQGATGWLVGEAHHGLAYMFIMMNAARFSVGIEGIGLCERAYQRALAYARDRVQGTEAGASSRDKVAIIRHPDVRRMLLQMKSRTEALRAVACVVALAMDEAQSHPDEACRLQRQAFVELMIPVVKGWSTETAVQVTSLGVQVHGGMGFIEETGAAQHWRDARITPIYEGTTGIQAADLIGRKVARDEGATVRRVIDDMRGVVQALNEGDDPELSAIASSLAQGVAALDVAVQYIVDQYSKDVREALAGAVPFLALFGIVAGGWQMARAALAARQALDRDQCTNGEAAADLPFMQSKLHTARFYADHVMPEVSGLLHGVTRGAQAVLALSDELF